MATAGVKISSLRELNTAEDTDYIVINDVSASTTKKISRGNFLKDITIIDGVVSDYRAKIVEGETENALSLVNQLKVYQTKYIPEMSEHEDKIFDSLIAHELQEVIPYAVIGEKNAVWDNGLPNYQKVNYQKLVPIMISAIQDLSDQVEDLKIQIEILRG